MTKQLFALACLLASALSFAATTVSIGDNHFELKRPHAINAVETAVDDMPGFLKNYKPRGAQVSGLSIQGDVLEFTVTKTILFITRSARVNARVDVDKSNTACPADTSAGFLVRFDLRDSEEVVVQNVDSIRMDFCVSEPSPDSIKVATKGFLVQGPQYDSLIGGMIVNEISNQIPALVDAFKAHVANQP